MFEKSISEELQLYMDELYFRLDELFGVYTPKVCKCSSFVIYFFVSIKKIFQLSPPHFKFHIDPNSKKTPSFFNFQLSILKF